MINKKYNALQHRDKSMFIDWSFNERFLPEKNKTPIWFEPSQSRFLFMDQWQDWDVFDMIKKGQVRFIKKAIHQGEWMLKFLYVHIDYEIGIDLIPTAILYRKKSNNIVNSYNCPFCYGNHRHGTMDGHRGTHCHGKGRETIETIDGLTLKRSDGYFVRSIEP